MTVTETFFAVSVLDMKRAIAFYVGALDATVSFETPVWTSLHIAGVRVGLFLDAAHRPCRIGLHFAVRDHARTLAGVERSGGRVLAPRIEAAPGVINADVTDTEGNTFALSLR